MLKDKNTPFKLLGSFKRPYDQHIEPNFTPDIPDENLILRMGSLGNEVKALQNLMNEKLEEVGNTNTANVVSNEGLYFDSMANINTYFYPLDDDGIFGELTEGLLFYLTAQNEITIKEFKNLS